MPRVCTGQPLDGVPVKQGIQAAFTDLRRVLPELPDESLPDFLGDLARLEAEARLRLNSTRQATGPALEDRLLGVEDAASRLGISTSQMYRTADDFPFTIRSGRALRFSSLGISKWIEKRAR
jgi:predicted DNA-binding transcriptional regulator AlpA